MDLWSQPPGDPSPATPPAGRRRAVIGAVVVALVVGGVALAGAASGVFAGRDATTATGPVGYQLAPVARAPLLPTPTTAPMPVVQPPTTPAWSSPYGANPDGTSAFTTPGVQAPTVLQGPGAPSSCNAVGSTTFCSDGSTYTQVGDSTLGSDGSTWNQVGNSTFGPDGQTLTQVGD